MVPVSSAAAVSQPPPKTGTKGQFSAGEYVARQVAAHFTTAGRVAGAIFDDALDQRGLPTSLGPQTVPPPATVVPTACAAVPSMEGSKAPVWAEEPLAPMGSDDPRVPASEEPRLIVSLDPGLRMTGKTFSGMMIPWDPFRRGSLLSGSQTWNSKCP